MMAELRGKETGYCRGRGGSMHIADLDAGNLGANGIVGGGIPIATGAALASRRWALDRVVMCFFGDGAMAAGRVPRSGQLRRRLQAARGVLVRKQPVRHVHAGGAGLGNTDIVARAAAYGIPGVSVDGNDVLAVYEAAQRGRGPGSRRRAARCWKPAPTGWRGHSKSDANRYRTREEIEAVAAALPHQRFERWLEAQGVMAPDD